MKVLQVIPSVSVLHGGPTAAIGIMERELTKCGASVTTLTSDDDGPGRRMRSYPEVQPDVRRVYLRKRFEFYKITPGMVGWLWKEVRKFDVVHIHALFTFSSAIAGIACRLAGIPYIVRPLGTLSHYGLRERRPLLKRLSMAIIESRLVQHASAVQFTSTSEMAEALSSGLRFNGVVVPIGIEDLVENGTRQMAPRCEQPDDGCRILFLSRLDPKKNVEGLLKAMALLRQRPLKWVLIIAGSGDTQYVASLNTLSRQLGINEYVRWLGHIDGEQKASVLTGADIFVLPSYSENFGIAAAEALLAGVPCVLSRHVAISGEIASAGAGIEVEVDEQSIAAGLEALLSDASRRLEMSARARQFGLAAYSADTMGKHLMALYAKVAPSAQRNS